MTKIAFETKTFKPDYRILVAKPGIYKDLSDRIVIVPSHGITTSNADGEFEVYGVASDGVPITNSHFHVFPLSEIKATVIEG